VLCLISLVCRFLAVELLPGWNFFRGLWICVVRLQWCLMVALCNARCSIGQRRRQIFDIEAYHTSVCPRQWAAISCSFQPRAAQEHDQDPQVRSSLELTIRVLQWQSLWALVRAIVCVSGCVGAHS